MLIDWLSVLPIKSDLSASQRAQLSDNGSLTRLIRSACPNEFSVRLIDQNFIRPTDQECSMLNMSPSDQALCREVFLCCGNRRLIFARTLLRQNERNRALLERIVKLGEQSLGSILFRDPLAKRRAMHFASIRVDNIFFKGAGFEKVAPGKLIWTRRSLYDYEGSELVVYEAFFDFPL